MGGLERSKVKEQHRVSRTDEATRGEVGKRPTEGASSPTESQR